MLLATPPFYSNIYVFFTLKLHPDFSPKNDYALAGRRLTKQRGAEALTAIPAAAAAAV